MKQNWKGFGSYGTVGLELALSVLLGLFVGSWLDRKLGTHWIALVGFGFGLAAGARTLWRALNRANREADRMDREDREARRKLDDDDDDAN